MLPNWRHKARGSLQPHDVRGVRKHMAAHIHIYRLNPIWKYKVRCSCQVPKNFVHFICAVHFPVLLELWTAVGNILSRMCMRPRMTQRSAETVCDLDHFVLFLFVCLFIYLVIYLLTFLAVHTMGFPISSQAKHVSLFFFFLLFNFLCQYFWLLSCRIFKGRAASGSCVKVHFKLF